MKRGACWLILLLAWNAVDDLVLANCALATAAAPSSDDDFWAAPPSVSEAAQRPFHDPPPLPDGARRTSPEPGAERLPHVDRTAPRFDPGPHLLYLLVSLQR